jgi:hypothetical protein
MKQTAVEWLEEELKANLKKVILEGDSELMESLFEQAKEMEEQQIKTAYGSGIETMRKSFSINSHIPKGAQEYYNDTFKK